MSKFNRTITIFVNRGEVKMNYQEKCLISRIENLRNQLNQKGVLYNSHFTICAKTYALSTELDKLIYQYMKSFKKSV